MLGPEVTNAVVFDRVARDIVRSVVAGYNGCIFAYGQTAAGKTWTMQGDKANPGVLPQAIVEVTDAIAAVRCRVFGSARLPGALAQPPPPPLLLLPPLPSPLSLSPPLT